MFSSPPRGSLISICEINGCMGHMGRILVPSTGFSYLNVLASVVGAGIGLFSSPPRGSLISIRWKEKNMSENEKKFSSPPRGSLISMKLSVTRCIRPWNRSRPLHGVLLSQCDSISRFKSWYQCSRPLHGVLLSQCEYFLISSALVMQFSSPPRGSLISILSLTPPKTQGFHPPFAGQTRKWEKPQYQTGV